MSVISNVNILNWLSIVPTKRNTFILKCFLQFTFTNLDGSQKAGVTFLIYLREYPERGEGSLRRGGGGSDPGGNYETFALLISNVVWSSSGRWGKRFFLLSLSLVSSCLFGPSYLFTDRLSGCCAEKNVLKAIAWNRRDENDTKLGVNQINLFPSFSRHYLFNEKRLQHWWFPLQFAKVFKTTVLKNSCEKLLLLVLPQNTIANSSGEFGQDETSTGCKVNIFLKRNNFIRSNVAISFLCKLKDVSLTFQLTFSLKFWICTLFKF